jgi:subfamily B ATP-binding cassette protein HlyB/CyaB
MQKKWEDALGRYVHSSFRLSNMANIAQAIANFFQKLMTISILYFGVKEVLENKMTIGQLIAFQMFANQFTNPVLRLATLWNEFQQTLLGVDRLGDILNHPIEMQSSRAITMPAINGAIKFESVSFRYCLASICFAGRDSLNLPLEYRVISAQIENDSVHSVLGPAGIALS